MLTKRFLTETQEVNIGDVWEFPHHRLPSVSPFEDFGVMYSYPNGCKAPVTLGVTAADEVIGCSRWVSQSPARP